MAYPRRLLGEDEEVLTELRPHWRTLLPALLSAMLLAAVAGAGVAALVEPWDLVVAAAAPVLWLLLAGRSVLRWWATTYVLTTERIIVRRGVVARSGTEIPLESIVNVLFSQRVWERLLGCGDVVLESAGARGQSRLENVPDPQQLQTEIYRARELRSAGAAADGPDALDRLERLADLRERGHLSEEEFARAKRRLLDGDD